MKNYNNKELKEQKNERKEVCKKDKKESTQGRILISIELKERKKEI